MYLNICVVIYQIDIYNIFLILINISYSFGIIEEDKYGL